MLAVDEVMIMANQMQMITYFRVESDFDTEKPSQLSLQPVQPLASVLEAVAGQRIHTTEKSLTCAARPTAVDSHRDTQSYVARMPPCFAADRSSFQ